METNIRIQDFIHTKERYLIIDMRDRIAYQHGHIDNALSLPNVSTGEIKELLEKEKKQMWLFIAA